MIKNIRHWVTTITGALGVLVLAGVMTQGQVEIITANQEAIIAGIVAVQSIVLGFYAKDK